MAYVVLDKSYLEGVGSDRIKSLCDEHTVLMPDVLFYELMTTSEHSRKRCFKHLPGTDNPVELIPNVGSLMRFELNTHQPSTPLYDRRLKIRFIFNKNLKTEAFQFTPLQFKSMQQWQQLVSQETTRFFQLAMLVPCFFPRLNGIAWSDFSELYSRLKKRSLLMLRQYARSTPGYWNMMLRQML